MPVKSQFLTSLLTLLFFFALTPSICHAETWAAWLHDFRQEALADGIQANFFDQIFAGMSPRPQVIRFAQSQPEKRLSFIQYRNSRADAYRIKLGRSIFRKNEKLLRKIGDDFGVNPCVVTAIWGMESSYGRYPGNFPVIQSLATLAYNSDSATRRAMFRKELLLALHILADRHVELAKFKGEWAGASGHPQFLPSSWYKYSVDYDHDGRRDIWSSTPDALASIANYLHKNGWKAQEAWGIALPTPPQLPEEYLANKKKLSLAEWKKLGLNFSADAAVDPSWQAYLAHPYGGPYFLLFDNFQAILSYNHSIYYAATIGYMADSICQ